MTDYYDLAVIGAGSGGIGAALAAGRLRLNVLLVEKADTIGGTAVRAGVSVWEMGVGGTGIPFDIYKRLKQIPKAVGIYSIGRHCLWPGPDEPSPFPGGESLIDINRHYIDSLRRHGARSMHEDEAFVLEHWHGVPFEPGVYSQVVEKMLAETGNCTLLKKTAFFRASSFAGRITQLEFEGGKKVNANFYIDSTADALLAVACNCEIMIGQESKDVLLPDDVHSECWWRDRFPVASMVQYPCGDLNVNMLSTMEGRKAFELGEEAAYAECRRRVLAHWHALQSRFPEFRGYRLQCVAPALGVRETRRIVGEYALTEHDLLAGLSHQNHGDIITIADHAMDTHGSTTQRAGCVELREPYGIPYRCLIPKGFENLLVACRGASFSSLAASSCRLSRTMMQLGQAAGTAAAIAKQLSVSLPDVPSKALRDALREQHVQLEWPMSDELHVYLTNIA
jgi:hypothetical protein